jgi:cysteine desulfurase
LLRCAAREVVFCGTATEANNLAVLGAAAAMERLGGAKPQLIGSAAEHPAVLSPLRLLQQRGFPLRTLPLDANARVDTDALAAALDGRPALLALQWANNETGAVQALPAALPDTTHFHCDSVQGWGKLPWDDRLDQAHSLVFSGHKFGAPKGIAALRLRSDAVLDAVLAGGGQQGGVRPGTESPALAAAFAHAMELAAAERAEAAARWSAAARAFLEPVRAFFAAGGLPADAALQENHTDEGLPNTLSLSFAGLDGRLLLPACDAEGLAVSSGSACSSGSALPSPVLRACGLDASLARATIRVGFGGRQGVREGGDAGLRLVAVLGRLYQVANRIDPH